MAFMRTQLGQSVQALVEENNIARCPHDIAVKIVGNTIAPRTICNVILTDIVGDNFVAEIQ
jgi:hypothetical protein